MNDPLILGPIAIIAMVLLALLGIPIGFALGVVGAAGLWFVGGFNFMSVTMQTMPFEFMNNYTFVVLPMFILMGLVAQSTGIITQLYTAAHRWTSNVRGGLLLATVMASTGFAAISGSTMVNAALFTKIAIPEMIRYGYHVGIGGGAVAASGVLAALIPPSLSFVIYGFLTGESIGQLLIAGLVPGLVTAAVFVLGVLFLVRMKPDWAPLSNEKFSLFDRIFILKDLWPTILLITVVLGGIYTGFMPPSAAGAIGAVGALILALVKRKLTKSLAKDCMQQTIIMTSVLTIIIMGGILFARFLTLAGFLSSLLGFVNEIGISKYMLIGFVIILFIVLGMFVDTLSIWVISVPVLHPLALSLGINPLWFAVFIVKLSEIGVISPPVGLNLFAVMSASDGHIRISQLYMGVIPFIAMEAVTLIILLLFPELATWLPEQMIH